MTKKHVLILGHPLDSEVASISQELMSRGAVPVVRDVAAIGRTWGVSYDDRGVRCYGTGAERFAGIWTRWVTWPAEPNLETMARSFLEVVSADSDCNVINPISGVMSHRSKPVQYTTVITIPPDDRQWKLRSARSLHVASHRSAVPREWWNDVEHSILGMFRTDTEYIVKPAMGGASPLPIDLDGDEQHALSQISHALEQWGAITIQERIDGTPERWVKIDDRWFRFEILATSLDYRQDPEARINRLDATKEMVSSLMLDEIAEHFHLRFAGFDLIKSGTDTWYFIEVNPCPMLSGFQVATGAPLVKTLADRLLGK